MNNIFETICKYSVLAIRYLCYMLERQMLSHVNYNYVIKVKPQRYESSLSTPSKYFVINKVIKLHSTVYYTLNF